MQQKNKIPAKHLEKYLHTTRKTLKKLAKELDIHVPENKMWNISQENSQKLIRACRILKSSQKNKPPISSLKYTKEYIPRQKISANAKIPSENNEILQSIVNTVPAEYSPFIKIN